MMREDEYCDLSDLQLYRSILSQLRMANSSEMPNKTRLRSVKENIGLMVDDLEGKVSGYVDE